MTASTLSGSVSSLLSGGDTENNNIHYLQKKNNITNPDQSPLYKVL